MARTPLGNQVLTSAEISAWAEKAGFGLEQSQAMAIGSYVSLLVKYNKKTNMVGKAGPREILDSLVVDSLHLARFLEREFSLPDPVCLDLGAGAGLPGIPLRALWTKGSYLLVEPRAKRAVFMETAISLCKIKNTRVFEGRVQDLPKDGLPADLILSRAFMPPVEFMALARPLVRDTGMVLVMANEPPETTPGYALKAVHPYRAAGKKRYFWGLAPASISN